MKKISKALEYASKKHIKQKRKNKEETPYINHLIDVMDILIKHKVKSKKAIVGAILHDVIEDTDGNYKEIEKTFSKKIADIVQECSDDKTLPKVERKINQIKEADKKSKNAKLVKIADKISNIKSLRNEAPSTWGIDRLVGYLVWSKKVVDNLNTKKSLHKTFLKIYKEEMEKYKEYTKNKSEDLILEEYLNMLKQ